MDLSLNTQPRPSLHLVAMQLRLPGCNRFDNVEATFEIRATEARQMSSVVKRNTGIITQYAFFNLVGYIVCARIGNKVARRYLSYPHCRGV